MYIYIYIYIYICIYIYRFSYLGIDCDNYIGSNSLIIIAEMLFRLYSNPEVSVIIMVIYEVCS